MLGRLDVDEGGEFFRLLAVEGLGEAGGRLEKHLRENIEAELGIVVGSGSPKRARRIQESLSQRSTRFKCHAGLRPKLRIFGMSGSRRDRRSFSEPPHVLRPAADFELSL